MNIVSLELGEGRSTYAIMQSILRRSPIICSDEEVRKSLVHSGKSICKKLYPDNDNISMPTPITYKELDSGNFNKSLDYIFEDINDYFRYKGVKVRSIFIES